MLDTMFEYIVYACFISEIRSMHYYYHLAVVFIQGGEQKFSLTYASRKLNY